MKNAGGKTFCLTEKGAKASTHTHTHTHTSTHPEGGTHKQKSVANVLAVVFTWYLENTQLQVASNSSTRRQLT